MPVGTERDLLYGIDRLVVSGSRLFGWGWVAHRAHVINAVSLLLKGEGWEKRLPVTYGLARDDVQKEYPQWVNARSSGFVVTGYFPRQRPRDFMLEVSFDGGDTAGIDVAGVLEAPFTGERKRRELMWLAKSVWRRFKRGDIKGILERAGAQNYLAPALDAANIVDTLRPRLGGRHAVTLVFDHNMGGGANVYRRTVIGELLSAGRTVLLCTYNLPTLDYRLQLFRPAAKEETFRIASFVVLERLLDSVPVEELFLNSPVSFDEPLMFVEWLATMRARHPKARLTIAMHDYFAVCPSFVLLNADGRYCGIPDVSECVICLKRHQASFMALSPATEIGPWRAIWGRCLHAADEVRCFSNSTRHLIARAYPDLDAARVSVIAHRVDFQPKRLPMANPAAPLVIGVIGQISAQKGAMVIKEMLAEIDRERPDVRVAVIGTLDVAVQSRRLAVTGTYRREDLVDLVEAHGVNMLFFPSICPETFSYVIEEMILLDLPIVAFDLGAPGERLKSYRKSRLCGEVSAHAALAALIGFHDELAATEAPVA
jgi:glycosyltransferase involved in cell wall biosynthesis